MTTILDALALLACLFGGAWCWRSLRRLGLGRLGATALTCLALYLALVALVTVWLTLQEAWRGFLALVTPLLIPLASILIIVITGIVGWLLWEHRQARRFFGG